MTKFLLIGLGVLVLLAVAAVAVLFFTAADIDRKIDFGAPLLTDRPNQYLVCPKGMCGGEGQRAAPVFDVPVDTLLAAVDKVAADDAGLKAVPQSAPERRSYVARSRLFRFPDRLTLQVMPAGEGKSTLAIYSQSKYGFRDLGVNEARVKQLLSKLEAAVK